jgi:ATP-dependent DNA helicase RecG
MLDSNTYTRLLDTFIAAYNKENRFLEFKSNHLEAKVLGEYISALSNGACLDHKDYGYIFFGVENDTWNVKGTTFNPDRVKVKGGQSLELFLRLNITPKIRFEIDEFSYKGKIRIVVVKIPAAEGEPTMFANEPFVRINESKTSLRPYTDWIREIYNSKEDWSKFIIEDATVDDLDLEAIKVAKTGYKERNPKFAPDVDSWDISTFLDRAKLTINGKITRTAILLVGKEESAHKLGHIAQIDWKLLTSSETAAEIFTVPFLLSTSAVLAKIRNYRFKIYPNNTLIPTEVWKYDEKMILEALHNCIAHQRYQSNCRIIVTEKNDSLEFWNAGDFYEGKYEDYIDGTKTPKKYRNPFLVQAMNNIKMIDSQGYGIHTMFARQKERFLPMPDYDSTEDNGVKLTIPGNVIDMDYSVRLIQDTSIDLTTAVLLDRVQKHLDISDSAIKKLRKANLIEGRKGHLIISKAVAKSTGTEAEYSKQKGFSDEFCCNLILKALDEHTSLPRKKINALLLEYLPNDKDEKLNIYKVGNLLSKMKRLGKIDINENGEWYQLK